MFNPKSTFTDPKFLTNLRYSGEILSQILRTLRDRILPGIAGIDLEKIAQEMIFQAEARPAFQGFKGYPFATCVTINEEVQHAFPDDRSFQEGDIVNVDLGVDYQGAITDAAFTVGVGKISSDARRVIAATENALAQAIKIVRAGISIRELGVVIEREIHRQKCTVVRDLCGHGCGHSVHEKPYVFNFPNDDFPNSKLFVGQTICIEPIASLGSGKFKTLSNGWTLVMVDGSLSAQSEKMILVTEDGCEVLAGI